MTREELIKRIALKMDEVSSSDDVIVPVGTSDNNPLYTQINNLLNESVNDVLMKAPVYRLHRHVVYLVPEVEEQTIFSGEQERTIAIIVIPDNFLRFVSVRDEAFQRPIVELAMEGDDMDKRQHNRHLVAKTAKPVAVLGRGENGRTITCYSYKSETPKPAMSYIKRYDPEKDLTADTGLDDYAIDLVSWVCAGRVFAAQGDTAKGKICDENAAALMI